MTADTILLDLISSIQAELAKLDKFEAEFV